MQSLGLVAARATNRKYRGKLTCNAQTVEVAVLGISIRATTRQLCPAAAWLRSRYVEEDAEGFPFRPDSVQEYMVSHMPMIFAARISVPAGAQSNLSAG